ncbi:MAG: molybdopterin-dependent oxidoreductase [Spirochaetia bacterium]|jgi:anaerobic dimethyl sulfoxide reductase subunit A|nr:molybdopterin-dependent oxidoreductase [Spirochaetia bacterium]
MIEKIPVSCNKDCGAGCPLEAHTENGQILKITDSSFRKPLMQGCLKGYRMTDVIYNKDRIVKPQIRTGERGSGQFRDASWDEALDLITNKLQSTKKIKGAESVMRLGGSGSCRGALHNTATLTQRFFNLYGGYTETTGSFSSEAASFVKKPMFGTKNIGIDVKTLLNSKLIILWGFNPVDTRFGCETESLLKQAADAAIPFVVIDPRKTPSVNRYNAKWLPLKAGTDSALMLSMLFLLLTEGLADIKFIKRFSTGFEKLEQYIMGKSDGIKKTPQWASDICGISVSEIENFTRLYALSSPSALIPGLSIQRTIGGENNDRLGAVLQLATANIGIQGGSTGSGQWNRLTSPECGSIAVSLNSNVKRVPVYEWADAAIGGLNAGYPSDISFLYNVGGNYIGQSSDTSKGLNAFKKMDFIVSHDYFMTPTCQWSDVVLPVTTFLEREDILFSETNYLFYSKKASEPVGAARTDYRIFADLSQRMGFEKSFTEGRSESDWIEYFLEGSEILDIDNFRKTGIYESKNQMRVGLSDFISDPEKNPLNTPSGKIEIELPLFPTIGGTSIPESVIMDVLVEYPLRLITPHDKFRIHSQNDNLPAFKKLIDDKLWMNPVDAEERGIIDGMTVSVFSEFGHIQNKVKVTDKIAFGIVSLNQGAWVKGLPGEEPEGSVNILSSTEPAMPSRGSRTHSIAVEVK